MGVVRKQGAEGLPHVHAVTPNSGSFSNGCVDRELAPFEVAELDTIWPKFQKVGMKNPRGIDLVPIGCVYQMVPAPRDISYFYIAASPR